MGEPIVIDLAEERERVRREREAREEALKAIHAAEERRKQEALRRFVEQYERENNSRIRRLFYWIWSFLP